MIRSLCLAFSALTFAFLSACATSPALPIDELRHVLSYEVWPNFRPLDANIVIYNDDRFIELASFCRESDMGCAPLPAPEEAPKYGAFFVPDNTSRDYAIYPNLGLLETTRLIAHEQFHAYQRSAPEFEGVDGVGEAPLSINDLDVNAVAAVLAGYRALVRNLNGAPQSCDQQNAINLPPPLGQWLLNIERLEGLAQYVDLNYGAKAAGAGRGAIAEILERELRRLNPAESYDILTFVWSSAYLTGTAKALLFGPDYVLGSSNRLSACTPSSNDIEQAKTLLQRSVLERRQAETYWARRGEVLIQNMSQQQYSVVSQKRLYYPWGTMLVGRVHIRSGEFNRTLPIAAIIRCGKNSALLVTPVNEKAVDSAQTGHSAAVDAINEELCKLSGQRL